MSGGREREVDGSSTIKFIRLDGFDPIAGFLGSLTVRASGRWSVNGIRWNDFFPGCFFASGFRSDFFGQNRRIPVGSHRFHQVPAEDRLKDDRNFPKQKSDRNPEAKNLVENIGIGENQRKSVKTGGIRQETRWNPVGFVRFRQLD